VQPGASSCGSLVPFGELAHTVGPRWHFTTGQSIQRIAHELRDLRETMSEYGRWDRLFLVLHCRTVSLDKLN
jgi:hypothetical protein